MTVSIETVTRVECTPWCTDGTGHGDAQEAADQSCYGPEHKVDLAPIAGHPGAPPRGRVVAHLYRDVYAGGHDGETLLEPPHIEVQATEPDALRLTARDARALGTLLIRLADEADGAGEAHEAEEVDGNRSRTSLTLAQGMTGGQSLWRCDV
jgi:hypothetical protein